MAIKSLGNAKISYDAVWSTTALSGYSPLPYNPGTETWFGTRGIFAGGSGSNSPPTNNEQYSISYINIASISYTRDFVDMT